MAPPRDDINTIDDATRPREPFVSPYSNKFDPMSNVSSFKIIDTTLRGKDSRNLLLRGKI